MLRLLIADQPKDDCDAATCLFSELGFVVATSPSELDTLARCETSLPDLLIVDSAFEGALDLIAAVRLMAGGKGVRILYGIAETDLRKLRAAKRAGADDVLLKPYEAKVLHALFDEILAKFAAA
jgi:two-component system, chemotaxis family, chemotaxis protein CheY